MANTWVVKGLGSNLKFLKNFTASTWVIDIIRDGYSPILEKPAKTFFNNHSSYNNDVDSVGKELKKRLSTGVMVDVDKSALAVCSPLGVVSIASCKLRLIMDLQYVNKRLRKVTGFEV